MATVTTSTNFFQAGSADFPLWLEQAYSGLDGLVLEKQAELDAVTSGAPSLVERALELDPVSVSATAIEWAFGRTSVVLSGNGFDAFSSLEEATMAIEAAIEAAMAGGLANGNGDLTVLALDQFTIISDSDLLLTLSLSAAGVTITSGATELALVGQGPGNVAGLIDLFASVARFSNAQTEADREASLESMVAQLNEVGVSSLTLKDNGTTLFGLSLSETQILLNLGDAQIEVNGTFPADSLGQIVGLILQIDEAEADGNPITSLAELSDLGLTNILVSNDGEELLRLEGPFTDDASFNITNSITLGTDGDDIANDDNIDVENGGTVLVELGEGDDEMIIVTEYRHWANEENGLQDETTHTYDGGEGLNDVLRLDDYFYADFFTPFIPFDRVISVDLSTETVTATFANSGQSRFDPEPYDFEVTHFEDVHFNIVGNFSFVGDDENNTVRISRIFSYAPMDTIVLDAQGGDADRLDLRDLTFSDQPLPQERGYTYDEFLSEFAVMNGSNGAVVLASNVLNADVFELINFERMTFLTEDRQSSVDVEIADLPRYGIILQGDDSDETLEGSANDDSLAGGRGNDFLEGYNGNDDIRGDGGEDTIYGGRGDDTIRGGRESDTIIGGEGDDVIRSQKAADYIEGGAGDDNIKGGGGNDSVLAGDGNDFVKGGTRRDVMSGGDGNDKIAGNSDKDVLNGDAGNDVLNGGGDTDTLNGGTGDDFMKGGSGADVFVFDLDHGNDRIADFNVAEDVLSISVALAGGSDAFFIESNAMVVSGGVQLELQSGNTILLQGLTETTGLESAIDIFG